MALIKIRLGDFLEPFSQKCNNSNLTNNEISGINREKEFFEPSNQVGNDTSKYKIVPPNYFACNLMHVGRDKVLPIALNHTNENKIVSPAYFVFKIKDNDKLLSDYLFILLKCQERDRYFWFHTDGSIRDGMTWDDLCNVELEVPKLNIQQQYVDVYNAMLTNQKAYETGLEDLKLVCDAYIENLRRGNACEPIGPFIKEISIKNIEGKIVKVRGVESSGAFAETKANLMGVDLSKYSIVKKGNFAFNPSRINIGSIAIYREEEPCIISPMYTVFEVANTQKLLPEYLMLWLSRSEFFRSTRFYAVGSVRDTFEFDSMCEVKIPMPSLEVQQAIANIYSVYITRKDINEKLKEQIKDLCPILIKGSIEEARKEVI